MYIGQSANATLTVYNASIGELVCFNVSIVNDLIVERNETYLLTLTSPSRFVANSSSVMNLVMVNVVQDDGKFTELLN